MAEGIRPTREAAEKAVEQFLAARLPDCEHAPRLIEDGEDGWAFWIEDEDTTSYVHHDLSIEWYGTSALGVQALRHQGVSPADADGSAPLVSGDSEANKEKG